MNWITKALNFGEKIKKVLRKRPSKEDIANSDWTSCCKGPILKKDLENNLWVCNLCGKHHRISCRQRFDIVFGKNSYQILESPIPTEDPLNWVDTKSYKERLKIARKKTNQNCAVMIATLNKTLKSYLFAIVGAEYVLKWLPIGTHNWDKFVKPEYLTQVCKKNSLTLKRIDGMSFNPILNKWTVSSDKSVNYISEFKKI